MADNKKSTYRGFTPAQAEAHKRYMKDFVEIKVRMTADKRSLVQSHAAKMGESATGFINRAIDETMARDELQFLPELSDKDEEARKVAGTSAESMKLTKLILEHGTPEQIERAEKDSLSVKDIAIEILSNMTVTE
ncbi:MAG: hypothetical protein ACLR6S_10935 [Lacrimispora saccharolytica]